MLHVPESLVVWVTVTVGDVVDVSGTCNDSINMYIMATSTYPLSKIVCMYLIVGIPSDSYI